jgi:hypothetical protein
MKDILHLSCEGECKGKTSNYTAGLQLQEKLADLETICKLTAKWSSNIFKQQD